MSMLVSWVGGLPTCSIDWGDMHMGRDCLLKFGTGTQPYSSLFLNGNASCAIACWETLVCFLILQDISRDCLECQKRFWTFVLYGLLQIVRIKELRLNAFSFFLFLFVFIPLSYKTP